jgi:peptide/nickel transport system permease protein
VAQIGGGDPTMIEELRRHYGLDVSVAVQLGRYVWRLLQLDLGFSAIYGKPVADVILERLPATLLLMGSALSFASAAGMALGVLSARRVNKWPDTLISTLGLVFYATPSFWFGLMGIVVFAVKLGWLPAGGIEEIGAGHTGLRRIADIAWHLLLPT